MLIQAQILILSLDESMKMVWAVIILFVLVMGAVVTVAFKIPSNQTGIDPAKIAQLRLDKTAPLERVQTAL